MYHNFKDINIVYYFVKKEGQVYFDQIDAFRELKEMVEKTSLVGKPKKFVDAIEKIRKSKRLWPDYSNLYNMAVKLLKELADGGDIDALQCYALLKCGYYGALNKEIYSILSHCSEAGMSYSTYMLGISNKNGKKGGAPKVDKNAYFNCLDLAIKQDNNNCYALNMLGVEADKQKQRVEAEKYYIEAIKKGCVEAYYNLYSLYHRTNVNYQKQYEILDKSVELGDASALCEKAVMYFADSVKYPELKETASKLLNKLANECLFKEDLEFLSKQDRQQALNC